MSFAVAAIAVVLVTASVVAAAVVVFVAASVAVAVLVLVPAVVVVVVVVILLVILDIAEPYLYRVLGFRSSMLYSCTCCSLVSSSSSSSSFSLSVTSKLIFLQPATSTLYDVIGAPLLTGCCHRSTTCDEDSSTCR